MIAIVIAVAAVFALAHEERRGCWETKGDIAAATIKKYAYEAYPMWRLTHEQPCPAQLIELNEHMNNKDTLDPWGSHYAMYCGPHGMVVSSVGEDGKHGTADDLWSR